MFGITCVGIYGYMLLLHIYIGVLQGYSCQCLLVSILIQGLLIHLSGVEITPIDIYPWIILILISAGGP